MGLFSRNKKYCSTTTSPPTQAATLYPQSSGYQLQYAPPLPERSDPHKGQVYGPLPSSGWPSGPPPPYPATPYQPYQQVFVSNNYILPPPPVKPQRTGDKKAKNKTQSCSMIHLPQLGPNIPPCVPGAQLFNDGLPRWHQQGTQYLNQGAALCDLISSKFNSVVTSIDAEKFSGDERELWVYQPPTPPQYEQSRAVAIKTEKSKGKPKPGSKDDTGCPIVAKITSANYFSKVNLYANSRLPPNLPPVKL
jgi:hypothetical protein